MKKGFLLFIITLLFASLSPNVFSQPEPSDPSGWEEPPIEFTRQFIERTFQPRIPDVSMRGGDWSEVIDSLWGQGVPTAQKLLIFNQYWDTVDKYFACFQDIDDQWDELRDLYLPEIEQGVSQGRFAAIMDQLSLSLRESHTHTTHQIVHNSTQILPGVPLMYVGGWGNNQHFGAGLTPITDSSLLVYQVVPNHPLGLALGDRVLGYDGVAWKDCYPQLLKSNLPIIGWWWGSSPSSFDHSFLMAAGINWHLFDTIDIIKYGSVDTIHLPTSLMIGQNDYLFCTEQMDIPGVPKPDYSAQKLFSYGIVEGTNIGYIYGWGWFWNAESEFLEAVAVLMGDYETDGLIIDFRMNYGGNMFLSDYALDQLFSETISTIDFVTRCDDNDHLGLCPENISSFYDIGQGPNGYDKPIALLTGPGAISSGDQVALRVKLHPKARVFGKSTSTAFNGPKSIAFSDNNWTGRYADADAYLLTDPYDYLTHNEFEVDEEVWHTPDAVANGEDAVVNAAIEWINSMMTPTEEGVYEKEGMAVFPNPTTGRLQIQLNENKPLPLQASLFDAQGKLVRLITLTHTGEVDVHDLSPGMYVLKAVDEQQAYIGKFVKQ